MSSSPNHIFAINRETNLPVRDVLVDVVDLFSQPVELRHGSVGYFIQSSKPGLTRGRANALSVSGGVVNRSVVNKKHRMSLPLSPNNIGEGGRQIHAKSWQEND